MRQNSYLPYSNRDAELLDSIFSMVLEKKKKENENLLRLARDISLEAEKAHAEVRARIRELTGITIECKVMYNPMSEISGCPVRLDNGKYLILVNNDIASFNSSNDMYKSFKDKNTDNCTPRDLFKNIVAHEYGHLIFSEIIDPATNRMITSYERNLGVIPIELDEAFAFWFGDSITETKSPLEELSVGYKLRGINFNKTIGFSLVFGILTFNKI